MSVFGADSPSTATDNRQASAGAASPNLHSTNGTAYGDNSLAVAGYGQYQGAGSIKNQGNNNRVTLPGGVDFTGAKLDKGSTLVINQSDPAVLQHVLDNATAISQQSTQSIADYLTKSSQASAASEDKVLQELSTLSESKQTDGQSQVNNTVLYIVGGLFVAIVAIAYLFRRK